MTASGNGGFIGVNAPVGSNGGSGVWSLDDALLLAKNNQWPVYNHVVSGGTITTITQSGTTYKVHTFTSPGVLTITSVGYGVPNKLDYLVIAGGGGSGANVDIYGAFAANGAGGGAGGLLQGNGPTGLTMATGSFPVTVGVGGARGVAAAGSQGNPSILTWSPAPISATGGGGGGFPTPNPPIAPAAATPGGSGGGGGSIGPPPTTVTTPAGSGTPGQGFAGGVGGLPLAVGTGGGGGAGGVGTAGGPAPTVPAPTRGTGGAGVLSNIDGNGTTFAVGGYGGGYPTYVSPNTKGSGGYGGNPGPTSTGFTDWPGKDGVVIVRYVFG